MFDVGHFHDDQNDLKYHYPAEIPYFDPNLSRRCKSEFIKHITR